MSLNLASLDASVISLLPGETDAPTHDHFVELYDDDQTLVNSIARFISLGIERGEAGIVVATAEHRAALEGLLGETVDPEPLYLLDAEELLARFMEDGAPDAGRFNREIGRLIEEAADGRPVRIFGEMVAVLWAQGNVAGALRLEDLWNQLADVHPFRLFCAYPTEAFGGQNMAPLRAVCHRHSHVIAAPVTL